MAAQATFFTGPAAATATVGSIFDAIENADVHIDFKTNLPGVVKTGSVRENYGKEDGEERAALLKDVEPAFLRLEAARFHAFDGHNSQVSVKEVDGAPLQQVTISSNSTDVIRSLAVRINERLPLRGRPEILNEQLPEYARSLLEVQGSRVEDLTSALANLENLTADLIRENQKFINEQIAEVESIRRKNEEEIRKQAAAGQRDLKTREEELDAREAQMDLRDPKAARRQLLSDIREQIQGRASVALSDETNQKRSRVERGHATLTFVTGVFFAIAFLNVVAKLMLGADAGTDGARTFNLSTLGSVDYIMLSSALITFTAAMIYRIKSADSWLDHHASAELRNIQLEADILRASWISELVFEWDREKDDAFPQELVAAFSHGLFRDPVLRGSDHPAETLTAMLREATDVKVGRSGLEFRTAKSDG